jgi:hypothetical protein
MIPNLVEISHNPEDFRLFLINQGFNETVIKSRLMLSNDFKVDDEHSFLWSGNKTLVANNMGVCNCLFKNESLFYSIALPSMTPSEIEQIKSVFNFIDRLFDNENVVEKTHSYFFSMMNSVVSAKNDIFTIFTRGSNSFSVSNKYITVATPALEFESIYSAILIELKIKMENHLKRKLDVINTNVFKLILDESLSEFVDRLFKDSTVKPVKSLTFLECFDPATFDIIRKDHDKFDDFQMINNDSYVFNVNDDHYYSIKIDIKNIKILRKLLIKSMTLDDINALIQSISMSFFYHNIMTPHDPLKYVQFTRSNILRMNKVEIATIETFYELSVGNYSFNLGKQIFIEPINSSTPRLTTSVASSTQELYENYFDIIADDICKALSTERNNVCVQDIKVLEMMLM